MEKNNYNYDPMTGEALSDLAKQREQLKAHNAGLLMLGKLEKSTTNVELKKLIVKFIKNYS